MNLLEAEKVLTGFAEQAMKGGMFNKFAQVTLIQDALKSMIDGQKNIETLTQQLNDGLSKIRSVSESPAGDKEQ